MKRILLDVNVVLDVLLDRAPFADMSSEVWAVVERGEAEGLLSAHALTTLHYLNAKAVGGRMARETTTHCCQCSQSPASTMRCCTPRWR